MVQFESLTQLCLLAYEWNHFPESSLYPHNTYTAHQGGLVAIRHCFETPTKALDSRYSSGDESIADKLGGLSISEGGSWRVMSQGAPVQSSIGSSNRRIVRSCSNMYALTCTWYNVPALAGETTGPVLSAIRRKMRVVCLSVYHG